MGGSDPTVALEEARKIEITYCSRIGSYQLNHPHPISITFQNSEDRQNLMQSKKNLPKGVYVNEEYPVSIKRNCDILRLILRLAKTLPEFREKSKLQGDKLIINGTHYLVNNIALLPQKLAAHKVEQKSDPTSLVFHGELSPYSNFHNAPFILDGQCYQTAEHYI